MGEHGGSTWSTDEADEREDMEDGRAVKLMKVPAKTWSTKLIAVVSEELTPSPAVDCQRIYRYLKTAWKGGSDTALVF